ncbi:hypothetical protein MKZ15_05755 [Paenibacillus sp. FSL R7-0216]|uniref:hypothetical protein n=1 Tax=Paenibacillus sp. FSL R7-0216 TaxID=2921677 RepID=UPI0030DD5F00
MAKKKTEGTNIAKSIGYGRKFTYTEVDGEMDAYPWLAEKIKEYAKSKYGMELDVIVLPDKEEEIEEL